MDKYFYRDFQLTSRDVTLDFSQYTVGDVGCVVWDAALVLAGYFDQLSKSRSLKNLKVLELGSGTGCVGLVLAALGGDVLLTDLPEMVPLMKRNASKNSAVLQGKVSTQAFEWGSDTSSLTTERCGSFNIVLAADCIYYKESLDAFIKTLEDLSSSNKSETEIYISYEDRESEEKKNLIIDFMNKIQNKCTILKIPFNEYREDFMCEDIHIFKITAKQSS